MWEQLQAPPPSMQIVDALALFEVRQATDESSPEAEEDEMRWRRSKAAGEASSRSSGRGPKVKEVQDAINAALESGSTIVAA